MKRFAEVCLAILLLVGAGYGYAGYASGSKSAALAQKRVTAFLKSEAYRDFLAALDNSVQDSLENINTAAKESEKADLLDFTQETDQSSTTTSTKTAEKSEKTTAKAIKKTNESLKDTMESFIVNVSRHLPAWIPGREYLVAGSILLVLVFCIWLANKYLK